MTKTIDQLEDEAQRAEIQSASSGKVFVMWDGFQFDYYDTGPFAKPQIDREEAIAILAADAWGSPAVTPDRVDVWFIENQRAQIREYCLPPHMREKAKPITATEIFDDAAMHRFHARYLIQPSWLAAKIAVQWWHDEDGDGTDRGWQGDFLDTIGM